MNVNKERATKVLDYMKSTNASWVEFGVQSKVAALTDERARFSFTKFIYDFKLTDDIQSKNDDIWIECPFHEDVSPSCSINEGKYVYHCFSCGSKGNLINFVNEYKNRFENSGSSYYRVLNSYLQADKVMQAELGFDTIFGGDYDSTTFSLEDSLKPFRFKAPNGKVLPSTYSELADYLVQSKADLKTITLFVILMQNHTAVKDIYSELFGAVPAELSEPETSISLEKLMEF